MKSYHYLTSPTPVRDYECDLQGVVNHAVYLHYMEHARHRMLLLSGESFARKHAEGLDLFVTRAELDYKLSLRSEESYRVGIDLRREGAQLVCEQDVIRESDGRAVCHGRIFIAAVQDGRLTRGDCFDTLLRRLLGDGGPLSSHD